MSEQFPIDAIRRLVVFVHFLDERLQELHADAVAVTDWLDASQMEEWRRLGPAAIDALKKGRRQ
jgi:hypothetical protein